MEAPLPSVSVALTTFNGAFYLAAQLKSLVDQSYPPLEIVVGDDGSLDDSLQIIDDFTNTQSIPVRLVLNSSNLGYAENFMRVAELCEGDLIAFCDQDDVWRSDKLEMVAGVFAKSAGVMMVYHNADLVDESGSPTGRTLRSLQEASHEGARLSLSPWKYPLGFTQTFRRRLLAYSGLRKTTLNPYNAAIPLAHDQWVPLIANVIGSVHFLNENLAQYRQHGGNQFGAGTRGGLLRKLGRKIARYSDYGSYAKVTAAIAEVLVGAATQEGEASRRTLSEGAERYRTLSLAYSVRSCVYSAAGTFTRLARWWWLVRSGYYKPGSEFWFGYWAGLRDLLRGVLMGAGVRHRSRFLTDFEDTLCMSPARMADGSDR